MDGTATIDLVRQAQAGDQAALDELVASHLPLIYNVVGRALNGGSDVDDLVQDTMVGIIRGLPELREPARFRSWAMTIAYRRMQEHYRRRYKGMVRLTSRFESEMADPQADFAERTVAELALRGQQRELAEAARWLEPLDRQLFSLWWQETSGELTRPELAASIESTPQHAAVRLQRMRERLDGTRVVMRALAARPRCPEFGQVVKGWDGRADSRWRKRLIRHTRSCSQCQGLSRDLVRPESLLQGIGLVALPATMLSRIGTDTATATAVSGVAQGFALKAAVVGSAAAIALGGVSYPLWTNQTPQPPPVTPTPTSSIEMTTPPPEPTPTPDAVATTRSAPKPVYAGVGSADLFVAPDGSDSGTGSRTDPFATLDKAVAEVGPGQTIALRGGTYRLSEPIGIEVSGREGQRITLSGYRDERAVVDFAGIPADKWGITQTGDFWTVRFLQFQGAPSHAYVCEACHDNTFRRIVSRDNGSSGLLLRGEGSERNQVLDSDFRGNGSGLGIMFGNGEGNLVRGVRAFGNDADGVDLGGFADPVTVLDSWSFRNGNGFTLGGGGTTLAVGHTVTNSAAWENSGLGFNEEGNAGPIELTRNTAFGNDVTGFYLPTAAAVLTGNVASENGENAALASGAGGIEDVDASTFVSLDPKTAEGERPSNGRRPSTRFLDTGGLSGAAMSGSR